MFSILIPTWNNLPYLQRAVDGIRRHSAAAHQVIVHSAATAASFRQA